MLTGSSHAQCRVPKNFLRFYNEAVRLRELVSQFRVEGAAAPQAARFARPADVAHASPARALGRKVASAFNGNAALATRSDWEEF